MVALPEAFDPATVHDIVETDVIDTPASSQVVALSPFRIACDAYVAAGYPVLPVWPGDKKPGKWTGDDWHDFQDWPSYAARQRATPGIIHHWKNWPDANIGIILGAIVGDYQVIALDFDTDDQDELEALQSAIPASPMKKRGARGYTAFYRAGKDVRTKRYSALAPTLERPDGRRTVLEILTGNAPRQTVMPPSIHPNGHQYTWATGNGLVPASELPVLEDHDLERLEDTLDHLGCAESAERARPVASNDDRQHAGPGTDYFRDINEAALANLAAWVPHLGLPKTAKKGGRWEAVADWRASSTGRPTHEREPNLSFHPSGIKDMGTDERYTACNAVMAAKSCDCEEAFEWLRGELGMTDDSGFVENITVSSSLREERRNGEPVTVAVIEGVRCDAETGEVLEAVSAEPISPPVPNNDNRPTADREFPEHLLHPPGLLGEIVDYTVNTATRPNRTLALGSALVVLGTIIGRRDATPTKSGTHLYAIALAGTGAGKEHPKIAGAHLLDVATEEFPTIDLVAAPEYASYPAALKELMEKKLAASFMDEFGKFLKRINSAKAGGWEQGITKLWLEAWGTSFAKFRTMGTAQTKSQKIDTPAYSIFGVSTPGPFYDALRGEDRENGFMNRMLLLPTGVRSEPRDPIYDYREVPPALAEKLRMTYRIGRQLGNLGVSERVSMRLVEWESDEAKALYDAFRRECDGAANGDFFVRSAEMAGRLATIVAVGREPEWPTVSVADITWGIAVAKWSAARMVEDAGAFIGDTPVAHDRSRIMAKLAASPGRRVSRTDVMKHLGFTRDELRRIITDMVEIGDITIDPVRTPGGGKPVDYLVAA